MFVAERMSHPVIMVHPEMPIQEALILMHKEHIRRLPVTDARGRLVGIVAERDLLQASPSEATSLSIWELNYLISKITVERVMNKKPITVTGDTPVEEAARIMADNKIGALPVTRGDDVIGIITETDLFKIFLELMGAREPGIRVTALVADVPGELARLTATVRNVGGNIIALGQYLGPSSQTRGVVMTIGGVELPALKQALEPNVKKLIDIRVRKVV